MTSIETPHASSPESFHAVIYNGSYSPIKADVLLLRSQNGKYALPESEIDPRTDEAGFTSDIRDATGLTVGPYSGTFNETFNGHWPEGAEAHKIILPYQRVTHFVLSRVVDGDFSLNSQYADAEWRSMLDLPDNSEVEPFSLVNLRRFQVTWALSSISS